MHLKLTIENGMATIECIAATEEEQRMLGILGDDVVAHVRCKHEGHYSYEKMKYVGITLRKAKTPERKELPKDDDYPPGQWWSAPY